MVRRIVWFVVLVVVSFCVFPRSKASAQDANQITMPVADNSQAVSDQDIQMLRKDLRAQRKQIIAANMNLSSAEAEKFWPIYEQYVSDLVKMNGTKYALIKEYIQSQGNLTDKEAESSVGKWVSVDESVAELRKEYIPLFRRALSPRNTALFYQLDRRVQLMIDLQLASSIPMIRP